MITAPVGRAAKRRSPETLVRLMLGTQKGHQHGDLPGLLGFVICGFIWDLPTLLGFIIRGVYMGYPYPNFCLSVFLGPYDDGFQCVLDLTIRSVASVESTVEGLLRPLASKTRFRSPGPAIPLPSPLLDIQTEILHQAFRLSAPKSPIAHFSPCIYPGPCHAIEMRLPGYQCPPLHSV